MISESTIKSLHGLLNDDEKEILKISIIETYGADVGQKVDKNPAIQDSINQIIYEFTKSKYPDKVERIVFDANESIETQLKIKHISDDLDVTTLKDFTVGGDVSSEVTAASLEAPDGSEFNDSLNNINNQTPNQVQTPDDANERDNNYNYNWLLDGRGKSSFYIDKLLNGLDEESREIVIKCLLYVSIFIVLISLILIILNTSNINQIQSLYDEGHRTFLFQYTEICNVNVRFAKENECVISEINKKISELSNSRFWNTLGLGIFSIISLFLFYQITTYRQSRDKKYQ